MTLVKILLVGSLFAMAGCADGDAGGSGGSGVNAVGTGCASDHGQGVEEYDGVELPPNRYASVSCFDSSNGSASASETCPADYTDGSIYLNGFFMDEGDQAMVRIVIDGSPVFDDMFHEGDPQLFEDFDSGGAKIQIDVSRADVEGAISVDVTCAVPE